MAFFLEFDHRVSGRTLDQAYGLVSAWLTDQKARVKEASPPSRIVASHGHALQPMGWKTDARKTIEFDLAQAGPDVAIRVRVTPAALNATDVRMRSDEARANWAELLAELWVRFGETQAVAEAARNAGVDWSVSLRNGKGTQRVGLVLLVLGLAVFILFFPSSLVYAGTGFLVAGVVSLVYGTMTVRSAKARLATHPR